MPRTGNLLWPTLVFACFAQSCSKSAPARPPSESAATAGVVAPPTSAGTASPIENPGSRISAAGSVSEEDCNRLEIEFTSRVPTVFILVDRSSSMFERGLWNPVKEGVLAVIQQLEREVRFGFSSYTGQQGMQCPQLTETVPIAQQNYLAIKQAYDAISKPQFKAETPTSLALSEVTRRLQKEPDNSPKYILLVSDGEPDFCDDPNVTCSRDAVVAAAQAAYAQGVGTFVFSVGGEVDRNHLGDVANAGVGQPVVDRQMAVHYQCPASMATYSAVTGNAPFFEPDVNDRSALVAALTNAIAGTRSCVFDLQGKIKIKTDLFDQGIVEVDSVRVGYGGTDGYRMNNETQLELLGMACQRLKQPQTKHVLIDFPCKAVELL